MSASEDLIDFDIIETQKENIQPLPSGRSAKVLANSFTTSLLTPRSGDTKSLNDAIRAEYETELASQEEIDDPLDIYDRYVKWTLGAYPSAQATGASQLRPLLERATKAFRSVDHYRNDARYLRLWLHYIRFFSDAPRETFAYLSRHGIGEGLALFYEEFATWLETAKRWNQADEVYKLGMDREARPVERLARKYGEFQQRFQSRTVDAEEPDSPALPTVRPALATKIDPFTASTPRTGDVHAAGSIHPNNSASHRGNRSKLAVFSDKNDPTTGQKSTTIGRGDGWESVGTIADRKKENNIEAKPWVGETLKSAKRSTNGAKMAVFRDECRSNDKPPVERASQNDFNSQRTACSGRMEHVFVCLDAIYPNNKDENEEMSIEELRAESRGLLRVRWSPRRDPASLNRSCSPPLASPQRNSQHQTASQAADEVEVQAMAIRPYKENRVTRPKKTTLREISAETQTIKTNLESPTGPKLRRKSSNEPTMTLHTRAATDDILDIFNQPLRNVDPMEGPADSDRDSVFDDDDFTSAGESTGTGRISTSDCEYTEANDQTRENDVASIGDSVSPWSEFTSSKHVPQISGISPQDECELAGDGHLVTAAEPFHAQQRSLPITQCRTSPDRTQEIQSTALKYVPIPPEDYEPPTRYQRDPATAALNRLPFMTPILERTETSATIFTAISNERDFNPKTPSRHVSGVFETPAVDGEPLSSPLQEIVNDSRPSNASLTKVAHRETALVTTNKPGQPIIKDVQCNPVDEDLRRCILMHREPPLSSLETYHDCSYEEMGKASEIRKYIKSLSRAKSSERLTASLCPQPILRFPSASTVQYSIRRELGKGAFAPVYLAEEVLSAEEEANAKLVAIKSEDPPNAWEYHIMTLLHTRLASEVRVTASLLRAHALHLFGDEGYLIEEYLDQGTLLDLVNLAKADPSSGQATLDESVVMFFTVELLRTVEAMHRVGILHGDLKADNCLVRLHDYGLGEGEWSPQYQTDGSNGWATKGLTLIDFGRSIDMTAFSPDVQFIADWKTGKQDCVEMRELRPWTYQVDYFGLAGVVHSLLFGKYMESVAIESKDEGSRPDELGGRKRYRVREGLKRYWKTEMWTRLFDLALNPLNHVEGEVSGRMPCVRGLSSIRQDMENWLTEEGGRKNGGLKSNLMRIEVRLRERKGRS